MTFPMSEVGSGRSVDSNILTSGQEGVVVDLVSGQAHFTLRHRIIVSPLSNWQSRPGEPELDFGGSHLSCHRIFRERLEGLNSTHAQ